MKIPVLDEAERLLQEANDLNPGPWVEHSRNVALAAKCIAQHTDLDAEKAFVFGLLHDIGRREGVSGMKHILDGYTFLENLGYSDAARICLTHSFPVKDVYSYSGHKDVSDEQSHFIQDFLNELKFDDYDKLLQLCDCLALPEGICLMEKRMVDVVLRLGFNEFTVQKWKAWFEIKNYFENKIGKSLYAVLPRVINTTFG
jgi:hypothetical protein